jgi:hypothetical protein
MLEGKVYNVLPQKSKLGSCIKYLLHQDISNLINLLRQYFLFYCQCAKTLIHAGKFH